VDQVTKPLTPAQQRYLAEIRAAGVKRYNGRARKPLEALRAAGLVEYDFELRPAGIGTMTELFTVRPVSTPGE
jgi:hypothetical protein